MLVRRALLERLVVSNINTEILVKIRQLQQILNRLDLVVVVTRPVIINQGWSPVRGQSKGVCDHGFRCGEWLERTVTATAV